MLAKDPALKKAFEKRLAADPAFAADPAARLTYFFERSPWYSAQAVGEYPVLRLDRRQRQQLAPPSAGLPGRPPPPDL
jgi:hypothetical protein